MNNKEQFRFTDFYRNEVIFSFEDHPFSKNPKHVLTICHYKDKWLLTKHKSRGLEFPGGNVENDETAKEAAVREVLEETGGIVKDLHYIGQYNVNGKKERIIKNVYFATIDSLKEQETYFETEGPVLVDEIPKNVRNNRKYSFIMKDDVITFSLEYIRKKFNVN